jgi:hypothetical protein
MDVTEVRKKTWARKEKTDDGREIGTGSQASQSLRDGKQGVRKENAWLQGDIERGINYKSNS